MAVPACYMFRRHPDQITPDYIVFFTDLMPVFFQLPGDPTVVKSFEKFFKKVVAKVVKVADKVVTKSRWQVAAIVGKVVTKVADQSRKQKSFRIM